MELNILIPGESIKLSNIIGWDTRHGIRDYLFSTATTATSVTLKDPLHYLAEHVDAETLGYGTPVTYRKGSKTMHLRPVFHNHVKIGGDIRLQYPNTWFGDESSASDLGTDSWTGTHPRYNKGFQQFITARTPNFTGMQCKYGSRIFDVDPAFAFALIGVECYIDQIGSEEHLRPYSCTVQYDVVYRDKEYGTYFLVPGATHRVTDHLDASAMRQIMFQYTTENVIGDPSELKPLMLDYLSNAIAQAGGHITTRYSPNYGRYTPRGPLPDPLVVAADIQARLSKITVEQQSFRRHIAWGDLAAEAYQSLDYCDNNGIQYLKEATEMREAAVTYADTLRKVATKSGRKRAKALAAAYLGVHYGWKLTLLDTADYIKELRKNASLDAIHRCSSYSQMTVDDWTVTARYHVFYKNRNIGESDEVKRVNAFLKRVDFLPTLENMWDSVPYSFVIDWFTNIGNNLTAIGNLNMLHTYNTVLGTVQSIRAVRNIPIALSSEQYYVSGGIHQIIYERAVGCRPIVPSFQPSQGPASLLNHSVEGVALVVSKFF